MRHIQFLTKLVLVQNFRRWPRAILGLLGIAISVCLVVWIIRGYEATAAGRQPHANPQENRFDIMVTTARGPGGPRGGGRGPAPTNRGGLYVDPKWMEGLSQDPAVAEFVPMVRSRVRVVEPEPAVPMGPFAGGTLVGTPDKLPPVALEQGRWLGGEEPSEAVISSGFAGRYGLKVGDETTVGGIGSELRLKIVGQLQDTSPGGMPGGPMMSSNVGDLYVTPAAADKVNGYSGRVNVVGLVLKDASAAAAFVNVWTPKAAAANPPLSVRSLKQQDNDQMGQMQGMVQVQARSAAFLAFLAACFIIFTTLNAGVRERLREYAALRAIALSRSQLVAMVFFEALLFAAVGWGLGLLLAKALLSVGTSLAAHLQFFKAGAFSDYPLGRSSILLSGLCAAAGGLAAAILPAWSAARIKPVDILGGQILQRRTSRFPWLVVGIGLALVVAGPVTVLFANVEPFKTLFAKTFRMESMGFGPPLISCAAMILGLALITPLVVRLVEAAFGPILAWVLRIDRRFLRQQLSGNLWRAVATTISLSAGLTLFVTALVWGYSMLVPFTPDESLPQMLVSVLPAGVPESAIKEVQQTPGVVAEECLPLAVEQPRLTDAMLKSKPFASVSPDQQHVLFMGVDPLKALGGENPVLRLTFIQGDRETAARKLAEGHYCLVPDHFQRQTGLGMGDKFSVDVPNAPGKSIEYTIAGVVYVPGWHWFTKFSEIRRRSGRALAVVFADYSQVKDDFGIGRISFFWLNAEPSVTSEEMEKRIGVIADRYAGVQVNAPGVGEAMVTKQYVKITERSHLIAQLNQRANSVIWPLTRLPLLVLVIASLAVFNAVFASVQTRFWQFGVLRGVGLSRGQLFRLILSESLMIFAAAGVLSFGAGVLLAWSGIHICTYFFYFGGMQPGLVLPWADLSLGFAIAFGLCLLAGLIPACTAARREPLSFIQKGGLAA